MSKKYKFKDNEKNEGFLFENGYDFVKVESLSCINKKLERGQAYSFKDFNLPQNFIIAVKYFEDEKNDKDKYIFFLVQRDIYKNWFTSKEKIIGNYPVFIDKEMNNEYGWNSFPAITK